MSKKIKAVNIIDEVANHDVVEEETKEEETKEDMIEEVVREATPKNDDEKITEIINEEEQKPKPKPNRKMITCPDCGKTMLERNFRYQHINVCGKVKQPKPRAKPIEEVIKEKREKAKAKIETETKQPEVIVEKPIEAPPKPDYWTLRREYNNRLMERKQQLVQKLVSKAF